MYLEHFGIKEFPFTLAPDPRYLYMSERHREALAHLVYGIKSNGCFVLLTGEVGTGKTTVCRCLFEQIPEQTDIAFILNPKLTVEELLATVCDELGIRYPKSNKSIKVFVDRINAYLLDAYTKGRNTVLIIEEAQNLSTDVLEQIRLLTNLETNQQKLLQIIMIGQPELREMLSRPELRQLSQRITAHYHLRPLSKDEVAAYVKYRLSVAGAHGQLFTPSTLDALFRLSGGIPRLINLLCDRSLLGAYAQGKKQVDKPTLIKADTEIFGDPGVRERSGKRPVFAVAGVVLILCVAALAVYLNYEELSAPVNSSTTAQMERVAEAGPEGPELSSLSWPEDQPFARSRELSYQALFELWDATYQSGQDAAACQQARSQGLSCLHKRGSLSSLQQLNRPAVLKLSDDEGREYYATVTKLRRRTATFVVGGEDRTVSVREIADRWSGDYTILWRKPPLYRGAIQPGDQGAIVEWLSTRLALVQGRAVQIQEKEVFDDALVKQVKRFQVAEGLVPDGIVGPRTIIHLNTAVGTKVPLLTGKEGSR